MPDTSSPSLNASREYVAQTSNGYAMLVALLAVPVVTVFASLSQPNFAPVICLLGAVVFLLIAKGFYMLQPNQAAAITLFGTYSGTDRATGLRWTWPWMGKKKLSVRANNFISDKIKVNDLRGNPIEMAAQIVWRVVDTAQALFDVDDYKQFVRVQVEAAVRTIGSRYPYDDFEHQEVTLRGNHDQVGAELRTELIRRGWRSPASRSTNAASPISPMRRRSPARCSAASRRRRSSRRARRWSRARSAWSRWRSRCCREKNVVELDDERRAAMVSNLMVVLCGERDTQPVVNTGTQHQTT